MQAMRFTAEKAALKEAGVDFTGTATLSLHVFLTYSAAATRLATTPICGAKYWTPIPSNGLRKMAG
jgi:hypothetical protein